MQICNWFYSKLGYRLNEGLSFLVYSYSWGSGLWVPIYNRLVYLSEPVLHDRTLTLIFVPIKLTGALFSLSTLQLTFSTQPQGGLRHSISGIPLCVSVLSRVMVSQVFTTLAVLWCFLHTWNTKLLLFLFLLILLSFLLILYRTVAI